MALLLVTASVLLSDDIWLAVRTQWRRHISGRNPGRDQDADAVRPHGGSCPRRGGRQEPRCSGLGRKERQDRNLCVAEQVADLRTGVCAGHGAEGDDGDKAVDAGRDRVAPEWERHRVAPLEALMWPWLERHAVHLPPLYRAKLPVCPARFAVDGIDEEPHLPATG